MTYEEIKAEAERWPVADQLRLLEEISHSVRCSILRSSITNMVSVLGDGDEVMNEVIFLVEEAPEGGWIARALGHSIFTEADDLLSLHEHVRDAVRCHFEAGQEPRVIRLHFVREEVLAL